MVESVEAVVIHSICCAAMLDEGLGNYLRGGGVSKSIKKLKGGRVFRRLNRELILTKIYSVMFYSPHLYLIRVIIFFS